MKKRLFSVLTALALCLTLLPMTALADEGNSSPTYSGGSGTEEDPWLISTVVDLKTLADAVNSGEDYDDTYFQQTADLDLAGEVWEPIGYTDSDYYFSGNYDGGNHSIINASSTGKADSDGQATVGIFGCVIDGTVSNLHVKNADFSANGQPGYGIAGGILACAIYAKIENCSVTNSKLSVSRSPRDNCCAGGIAGYSQESIFSKCASISNEISTVAYGGGLVGENTEDDGCSSYIDCLVSGGSISATVDDGHSTANFVGMFIGQVNSDNVTITNCYVYDVGISIADESLASYKSVGIFAGNLYTNGWSFTSKITTDNCYYGKSDISERKGTATEKAETEFADGTVTKDLGDSFVQGPSYPILASSPADYSVVDAAIAKANALNKSDYQDFSTVEAAISAVVRGKNITEQDKVDAMAKAIEDAIAALAEKPSEPIPTPTPTPAVRDDDDDDDDPSYPVTVPGRSSMANGSIQVTPRNAEKGSRVTITVTPDPGYVLGSLSVTDYKGNALTLTDAGDGKYTFTMPGSAVKTSVSFVPEPVAPAPGPDQAFPFADVKADAYYREAVRWAVDEGITSGTSATTFGPDLPCVRGQIVTFLWRAAGSPAPTDALTFTDVAEGSYCADAVRWAAENGIASGTSKETFSPDLPCTRAQMAAFLYRSQKSPAVSGVSSFTDVSAGDYFHDAVLWAAQNGITSGISATAYGPDALCTRAQMVMFLYRLMGK